MNPERTSHVYRVPADMVSRLIPRYSEPHRRYHTWSHIAACFDARELLLKGSARVETKQSALAVDLALLYHDAIYEPLAKDNEERSAKLLLTEGRRSGIDIDILECAEVFIQATQHNHIAVSDTACMVVDADLSILGAESAVFDEYEKAIREEYKQVSDPDFARGRTLVLQKFLNRSDIFQTQAGRRMWESQARQNLERSVRHWEAFARRTTN